jgi:GNAT superfamily N-acetyltransferase
MHEFPSSQRNIEKQIISANGIPVRIKANQESAYYSREISLGIGGMVKMGEIQDPVLQEEAKIQRHIDERESTLQRDALARVRIQHPEATLEYSDYPMTEEMIKRILEENPALHEEIESQKALLASIRTARYQFGDASKDDLYVGKEGALIYSLQTGEQGADELKKVLSHTHNADSAWIENVDALRARMLQATNVADIHQVEVLPEYQGKGLSKALLDVALWNIEHTQSNIEFTVARVLHNNPDKDKMIAAFKKAGFEAFMPGQIQWDEPTEYTLVIRENPHFVRKT